MRDRELLNYLSWIQKERKSPGYVNKRVLRTPRAVLRELVTLSRGLRRPKYLPLGAPGIPPYSLPSEARFESLLMSAINDTLVNDRKAIIMSIPKLRGIRKQEASESRRVDVGEY